MPGNPAPSEQSSRQVHIDGLRVKGQFDNDKLAARDLAARWTAAQLV